MTAFRGLAAGPAILAWANTRIVPDPSADSELTMQHVSELAQSGDPAALDVMDRQGYYLGLGLANLVTTFCPDMIALGGGVMRSAHLFLGRARQVIRQCCTMVPFDKTELALASLGADTALAGAAQVWHHRFGSERQANAI